MTTLTDDGLRVLDDSQTRLLRAIEGVFLRWAGMWNAPEHRYPPLLRARDLDTFHYFDAFPQAGLSVAQLDPERLGPVLAETSRPVDRLPGEVMGATGFALPMAACYWVYIDLAGAVLPEEGTVRTTVASCFRNEAQYDGLQRVLGFTMREFVCVGSGQAAREHYLRGRETVLAFGAELGLDMRLEVAGDPFFEAFKNDDASQREFPVKEEFVVNGLAIGSANYHRKFFTGRLGIQAGQETAHTSCLGFGLERWVHTLTQAFGSARAALSAVERLL
ncbi:hypothetical protein ACIBH1_24030 [Nonomuraea sp. NPDC050663]|uniref:hypothetical protein n=1 Tax=Nonomuraea sp. NPDC050663 TaxID=3364370 RepID=UPI00378FC584